MSGNTAERFAYNQDGGILDARENLPEVRQDQHDIRKGD